MTSRVQGLQDLCQLGDAFRGRGEAGLVQIAGWCSPLQVWPVNCDQPQGERHSETGIGQADTSGSNVISECAGNDIHTLARVPVIVLVNLNKESIESPKPASPNSANPALALTDQGLPKCNTSVKASTLPLTPPRGRERERRFTIQPAAP